MNYRQLIAADAGGRVDLLVGYRHLGAGDTLLVAENLLATLQNPPPPLPAPGTRILLVDRFLKWFNVGARGWQAVRDGGHRHRDPGIGGDTQAAFGDQR